MSSVRGLSSTALRPAPVRDGESGTTVRRRVDGMAEAVNGAERSRGVQ